MTTLNAFTRITFFGILLLMLSLSASAQLQWERIAGGLAAGRTIPEIVVDSTGRIFALNQDGVLYRWEPDSARWPPPDQCSFSLIECSPLMVTAVGLFMMTSDEITIQQGPYEVKGTDYTPWQSTNGGEKWAMLGGGRLSDVSSNGTGMVAAAFAHTTFNSFANGIAGGSIILSTDNGNSWSASSQEAPLPAPRAITVSPSGTIFTGGMDESDASGRCGFFRSTDLGVSWEAIGEPAWNDEYVHNPVRCLATTRNSHPMTSLTAFLS